MKKYFLKLIVTFLFFGTTCCTGIAEVISDSKPISHKLWNELLQKHVSENGKVNYKGFKEDKIKFKKYLDLLSANYPNEKNWSERERLAYWINAYNAFTINLIVSNYPTKSIKTLGETLSIPGISSVWDYEFFSIEGEKMDLNDVEHNILRKKFNEPRIHFAIVCASASCPQLRNEAFEAAKLEAQLHQQATNFVNDTFRNQIGDGKKIKISKLFSWFSDDFTKNGSLIEFLNKYSKVRISKKTKISYLDYDWSLNE